MWSSMILEVTQRARARAAMYDPRMDFAPGDNEADTDLHVDGRRSCEPA